MPYVICDGCKLVTYSAALWACTEECPRCGAELPRRGRRFGHAVPPKPTRDPWFSRARALRLIRDDDR
jgi:predicted amidophosphoribosyltransferase